MRDIQRLRNIIRYLPPDSAIAREFSAPSEQEFSMENTREVTTSDLKRMHPGLFVEN